ncbi:hypothetical protein, partial [Rhizobium leguminosarum]|uniref:hypothetical protein n=1 Tax=Rhizobium leguminosarum TaxID=384 RepID=UPI003F97C916
LCQNRMVRILQSPEALWLERDRIDFATGIQTPAKYTTREMIRREAEMVSRAIWLSGRAAHGVREAVLEATCARHARL